MILKEEVIHIFVIHMAQQLDFPQGALGINPVIEGIPNFLHGHFLLSFGIESRAVHNDRASYSTTGSSKHGLHTKYRTSGIYQAADRIVRELS